MGYVFLVSLFSMAKQFGPLYLYSKDKSAATVIDMYANMWICMIWYSRYYVWMKLKSILVQSIPNLYKFDPNCTHILKQSESNNNR